MQLDDLDGARITAAARTTLADDIERAELHRALLEEPLCVPMVGPPARERTLKLSGASDPVPIVDSVALGAPVIACYASAATLVAAAEKLALWPDGVRHAQVFDKGALFAQLKGHPGVVLIVDEGEVAFDAGEIAALADGLTPSDFLAALQKLVATGRGREAAKKLAGRMVYVLGHPAGGMVMFQRELPIFLHRRHAEDFANRMALQMGKKPDRALVAIAEIFQYAVRGKLSVLVAPGPLAVKLRHLDLR